MKVFLILKQPDLGSAIIILASWGVLLFASGINRKNLAILIIIGILGISSSWIFLKDYQKEIDTLGNKIHRRTTKQGRTTFYVPSIQK